MNEGWLPPLLSRIAEDNTRVLCPMIDIINADTFEYTSSPMVKGGFNWGLHFSWEQLSEEDLHHPKSFATAFRYISQDNIFGDLLNGRQTCITFEEKLFFDSNKTCTILIECCHIRAGCEKSQHNSFMSNNDLLQSDFTFIKPLSNCLSNR